MKGTKNIIFGHFRDNIYKSVIIYENLIIFDFPSGITPGLRRKCDVARGIIEKTRGELTMALQFHKYASNIK